jgi:hypothetical protein
MFESSEKYTTPFPLENVLKTIEFLKKINSEGKYVTEDTAMHIGNNMSLTVTYDTFETDIYEEEIFDDDTLRPVHIYIVFENMIVIISNIYQRSSKNTFTPRHKNEPEDMLLISWKNDYTFFVQRIYIKENTKYKLAYSLPDCANSNDIISKTNYDIDPDSKYIRCKHGKTTYYDGYIPEEYVSLTYFKTSNM